MPTQALLKATLLKETYGPLVELNGPSKSNHAVATVFPSRLSGMERQFLDLIAPQLFSIRGVQEYRRSARRKRPGLNFQDFVDDYERLLAASWLTKRYAKVAHIDEDFEFSTTQLHQKVSTPQRHLPNILFDDFTRAAEKPVSSPEETLKNCRNAILETVIAKLDDEEGSWPVWDAKEDPSGILMPFANLRMRQHQVGVQLEKSGLSNGTASSSPPMSATIGGETIGKKMVDIVIQHTAEENGRVETANFAKHLQQAHKGATEEAAEENPVSENSNARLSSSRSMSLGRSSMSFMELKGRGETANFAKHLQQAHKGATEEAAEENPVSENSNARLSSSRSMSLGRSSMSFMDLLVDGENVEDKRRSNSSRGDFHQGLVSQRRKISDVDEVDLTLQTTEGGVKSVLRRSNSMRTSREFDHLAAQPLHNKRSHNFAVDALDQRVNNTAERCPLGRQIVDAIPVLNSSERLEVSENPSAKSHGNDHRRLSSLERFSNFFGKSRLMKESTRFTEAKQDSSRGCPEVSHISDSRQVELEKTRSLRGSAVFRMGSSKSGSSEVSKGNQTNSSAANSHRESFWERSLERFRRSLSTRERACPAAGHDYLNSFSSTTTTTSTRSWAPAMQTIASKTVDKLQGMLGRSTSLRATHTQPIAERDEAKSTRHYQERNESSNLPHSNNNEASSMRLPMDGNNVVGARCGTRSAESSFRGEEAQTISRLLADELKQESKFVKKTEPFGNFPLLSPLTRRLKRILGRGQCKVSDAINTKVGKASLWSAWSISYTDGLSPPKESLPKKGLSLTEALGESPRSSSPRRTMSPKRMPHRGYSVSPKRKCPRGYPVSPRRVSLRKHPMSPKRNGGFGTPKHITQKAGKSVKSDGFNKRRLPNRSDPTPRKVHPTGRTEELTRSGVPRPAATTLQMELTDMGYSGARNFRLTEQYRVANRESKGSNVWPRPVPDRRRPTSSSRFQREHIAIHTISDIACEN